MFFLFLSFFQPFFSVIFFAFFGFLKCRHFLSTLKNFVWSSRNWYFSTNILFSLIFIWTSWNSNLSSNFVYSKEPRNIDDFDAENWWRNPKEHVNLWIKCYEIENYVSLLEKRKINQILMNKMFFCMRNRLLVL